MATKSIGYVAELIGDAQVRSVDGVIRVLSIGDQIHEGDILTTGLDTQIVLEFYNGNRLQVAESTEILLDESVFAGLSGYPEARVDQLAELQSLIVEGVDLAELEATAAGAAGDSDALHQASVYSRTGDEGIVETRLTPFDLGAPGPDDQSPIGDDAVTIPSADTPTVSTTGTLTALIAVDDITADDIINAAEMAGMINVTGNVGGLATIGDSIDLNVNGTVYSGTVTATNTFSIPVAAADLMVDTSFEATVSGIDGAGNPYSATTTSSHTVDTTATASITLDANITPDDIIDDVEAAGMVSITGTVAGDFQAGDIVTLTVNGVSTSGGVLADGSFSIDVNGSDLRTDPDSTVDASFIATDAAGNVAAPVTFTESYTVKSAPDAIDDVGALDGAEDTTTASLNATLLANDSDPDGDPIDITAINGTALVGGVQSIAVTSGIVNIDASGNITFTPDANYSGPVSFDYTLSDGSLTNTATVSGTISPVNDQPVASDIAANAVEDGPTVTASFVEADADTTDTHSFAITSAPAEGSVINNNDGTFTFDPGADFQDLADGETRDVTFTYTATDDSGAANDTSAPQTVTVTVTGTNDQPVASDVAIAAAEDGTTINGNFTVTDGDTTDTHTFAITSAPLEGSVVNNGDGTFTFDPGADFQDLADGETRDVTFTYTATDDSGAGTDTSAPQTVTVTVTGTNDQPVASDVAIAAAEDGTTINGNFTVTDADTTDTHTFAITSAPLEGSVVNNGDGTFTFDPGADFQDLADGETRDVTFTYTATDDSGVATDTSAPQTVTVTVTGTNDQPVASDVAIAATEDGATINGNFTVTDGDTTDTHTFAITSAPLEGSVANNGDGTFTFDPGSDFQDLADGESRDVTFTYTATDDSGVANDTSAPQTVTVTVTGTNDQPVASDVAIAAVEDGVTVTGNFTVTDSDTTDTHNFAITSSPAEGSVINNNDGTFTFDPGADFQDLAAGESRDVTFTYTATDDSGTANDTSAPQMVTVTVVGTNDQPVASDVAIAAAEDGATVTGNFTVTDADPTDTHTFAITSAPLEGSVVNNGDGTFTFDPGADFQDLADGETRDVTFTYTATDDSGAGNATSAPQTVTVTVSGTNDQPVASDVAIAAVEDGATVTGNFTVTDADPTDTHTFAIASVPAEGSLVNNGDGTFTFDPGADFQDLADGETRDVTFTYTATDDSGVATDTSAPQTVTVTVTGTNDQPVASDVAIAAAEDGATVTGNFTVTDGDTTDTHTFAITSAPAEGSVINNNDGTFTFDPGSDFQDLAAGETRDVTFAYTATDDSGVATDTSAPQTVTVTVTGTNDQPVASDVAIAAAEDGATVTGNFTVTDADPTDAHTFTIASVPAEGSVVNNADGTFTFDPGADFQDLAAGETRDVTFTYTATDDSGVANDTSAPQTVTVTVTGTNDQPVAGAVAIAAADDGATVTGSFVEADADTSDTHTFAITSAPTEGSVINNNDGTFTFDPGSDFQDLADGESRDVTFAYTATDDSGVATDTSAPQTVTVTVTGTNDQPVASDVAIAAAEDGATINGNFTVADADTTDTHTFAITSSPAEGSVINNNDGTFTFDPGSDFQDLADGETRDVTFAYTATDDSGAGNATSAPQSVTVTVTGTNDQPVASDVAIAAAEDGATINRNFIVTDADTTDTHTFAITSAPSEGSVVNNGDGTFTFDPGADFQDLADGETRDVTFTYTATDDSGAANDTSAPQTVTVTVTGTNDQPVASDVAIAAAEDGATINGNFTVADSDTTDTHTFAITSAPTEGSVINNNDGTFTFDPGSDFQDLADGETRDVTFTYTAMDDSGVATDTSAPQTVTVTVTGTNDQPVATDSVNNIAEDSIDVPLNLPLPTDIDVTDVLTVTITGLPDVLLGTVTLADGSAIAVDQVLTSVEFQGLEFDAVLNATGTSALTYEVDDGSGTTNATDTGVATITVGGTNDIPVAVENSYAITEDVIFSGNVITDDTGSDIDSDPDGDPLTVSAVEGVPANVGAPVALTSGATLTVQANGDFDYDPGTSASFNALALGETANETFTYTIADGNGGFDVATVTLTVTGTNDQPVASDLLIAAVEDGATINGNFTVADADTTDTHTFAITGAPTEGSVINNNDGTFTFDPGSDFQDLADGESRDVTFAYTATDDSGAGNATSAPQSVTVTVTGTNDQPVASDVAIAAAEDGATINRNFIVTDADTTDTHTFAITSAPSEGSVVNNGDGTFTFDPGADFQDLADGETRDVTFAYTATDDSGAANDTSAPQTVTVTVTGTNDQPVASDVAIAAAEDGASINGNFTVADADTTDTHTFVITGAPAEGSVVNNGDGTFTFDPGADFQDLADGESRDVTFTYTATDDSGAANDTSAPQTVTVTVTGTNDQPVASDVAIAAVEDSATVTGNFTVTDADTTDAHTFAIAGAPTEGSVINNNDGTFTFDPGSDFQDLAEGETRDVTFTYTATDDSGAATDTSAPQTVTVTVTGTNDQPVASDVAIAAVEDSATVTGNFTVTDADTTDAHTFAIAGAPTEGSVINNNDGTFTFDPGSDFQDLADGESRDVTFTYTATDDSGAATDTSAPQTVTVTVTGTNDQPVASDVAIAAAEDGTTINGNFTVTDGDTTDAHTFAITSAPLEGSVVNNADGTFTFDPGADFQDLADGESRDVTFTYTATDDSGAATDTSAPQTVTVTVTGTNDQPIASDVAIAAAEDGATINGNFTVADGDTTDTHTFAITSAPTEGSVINNNDGTFTFDPGADFQDLADGESRDVTFTYTATDDSGVANDTSAPQTVTVTVTGTNDQPVASDVAIAAAEDGATINRNFIVTDADTTDTHTFAITSAPSEGSVVNNGNGTFTFDPGSDFQDLADGETRDVTFTYTATDDSGAGNATSAPQTVTVTVTGTNDQPVASNVAIAAAEDWAAVTGSFTVTDSDATDTHTFAITSAPSEGSVVNNGNGTFTFDPGADFQDLADGESRDVTFTYTATDDSGAATDTSAPQTVTVTVTGTNDQPIASDVAIAAAEDGATINGNFTVTDSDATDTHTFAITGAPAEGSVVNNGNGTFTFDPGSDFQDLADGESRDVTFTYTATDDSGAANDTSAPQTVTVTVTGTNDQPIASDVAIAADEDGATINGNFTVADGDTTDTHTFAITSAPTEGSVINNNDGTFTFDPGSDFQDLATGETRDVTFTFTATDDSGAATDTSAPQTVTVTVTGTNDQPIASDVAIAAAEDGATINGNFTVADGDTTDTHTFAITGAPSEGSVVNNGNGTFTFDPGADFQDLAAGETRDVSFAYTATDDSGVGNATSAPQTVTVTVTGTNDQPVASDVAIAVAEDGATINGNFTVADADTTDTHTFAITSAPSEGNVVNNGNGTFTFDPGADFQDLAAGETRDVTFAYTAIDDSGVGNATSAPQTVTVTVTGTNDQPVASDVAIAVAEDGATINGNFTVTDSDATDTHTFAITGAPAEGSVVNNGNGTFTFDPGSDFQDLADGESRDVTFTYTATDDSGAVNATSAPQTVTVTVTGTNDQPVASNVAIAAAEDGAAVTGSFTVTDGDATDTHVFAITSAPLEGSVVNNGNGTFTFDPGADFQDLADGETRDVTFTYTATDDSGAANDTSAPQTVTVTVTGTNDQPVASDVAIAAAEDGATINGNFTVTDSDTTDTHTFAITGAPAEGSVVNNGDGTFTFDPGSDFQDLADGETRDVTFTYTATDDSGAANDTSAPQMVTVTVTGTNDQPVASDVAIAAAEDGVTFTGNFTVADADTTDTLTFAITSLPSEGSVVNNGDGTFTFDPGSDFQDLADGESRDVTFTYIAADDSGAANDTSAPQTVTVTVTGANDAAIITVTPTDTAVTEDDGANQTAAGTISISDIDNGEGTLISSTATYGSVTESGGNWTYTLNNADAIVQALAEGETLVDTITFTSDDGTTATQNITITGTNDAAMVTVTPTDTAVTEDDGANQTATGTISISDIDNGEGTLTSSTATYGSVTESGGNWTYTLNNAHAIVQALGEGETLVDTITFTSDDGTTATQNITITGTNDAPMVTDDYYVVADNTTLTVNSTSGLLINDIDPDGDSLSVTEIGYGSNSYSVPASGSVTITTTNGELTVNSDGSFVYTPASADVLGVEDFTYTVTDSQGASTNASFGVEVDAVAENPTLVSASLGNNGYAYSIAEDKATGNAFLWRLDMVTGDITKIGLAQSIELDTTIGLPAAAAAGDTLTVVAEGETVQIVLTAADITKGSVSVTFHPTGAATDFTASASLTDASGNTTPSGIASALIDHVPSNAPSVTITEDSNNNRVISATELAGVLNVAIGIPSSAVAGDVITITDGTTTTALVLTAADISSGNITTTFGAPVEGSTITVQATHTDGAGNVSETGIDSALLNTLGVDAPTVSINKDGDGDGFIDFGTLKVQELDIEGLTYDPVTGYLYGMGTGQHPGLFAFSADEAYIAQNGGSAIVREYLELSGPNNDLLDINSGSMGGTIGPGDTLYYTNVEGNSSILYSIDKATGELTEFGDLGVKTVAFDYYQETGEFLGLVTSTNKTYLHSFDLSDPGNITNTRSFEIGQNLDIQGMSPGPNGNLWALDRATGEIYEIDVNTGTVSLLVSTAVNELQGDGFESLAVGPRPNNLEAGAEFNYNLSANFGTNNLAEEIHYFLVHLPDAAMTDGLTFPTGQPNTSLVTLAAGNNYGLTAGTYVRIEADPTIGASGTAEVSIVLEAPVSSDSFELSVYAVEEDTRVDLNLATNFAVTPAADDQTFVTTFDTEISGSFADGSEGTSVLGSNLTDSISGNAGDDIIFGADNDDWISGGAGSDKLNGGAGADILIGGSGDDSLVGGDGIDIFALESGDEGTVGAPAIDTIADFTPGVGGDVLDLSDMLQGEDLGPLDEFLNFSYDGDTGATTISIDVDGNSGLFETSQQIVLIDVDLTANNTLSNQDILGNLLSSGNLIVDQ